MKQSSFGFTKRNGYSMISHAHPEEAKYIKRFIRPLLRQGWRPLLLAGGYFTRVVLVNHDWTKVCKISGNYAGNGARDSFKDFALWAATQNSLHLPKIYRVGELRKFGLFVTVMERLDRVREVVSEVSYGWQPDVLLHPYEKDVIQLHYASNRDQLREDYFTKFTAKGLARIMRKMVDKFGIPNDLHFGNIMVRNGCAVILDPYANFSRSY